MLGQAARVMQDSQRPALRERPSFAFIAASIALHALLFFALRSALHATDAFELTLPTSIELGLAEPAPGEPGKAGAPPPAAPKPEAPPKPNKPVHRPVLPRATAASVVIVDAGVSATDSVVVDAAVAAGSEQGAQDGAPAMENGDGVSPLGGGMGLGFGAGGFGSGGGGPVGAVIGLHADLGRVGDTSLVLETDALLGLIPGWQDVLEGSGLDPVNDLQRVFVATPTLRRQDLVVSARVKGGARSIERAAASLAAGKGGASFAGADASGVRAAPWRSHDATERVVALLDHDQIVIARPSDVARVQVVAAALAKRHAHRPGMERTTGPAALLAMYEDEAVALSVEGTRTLAPAFASFLPKGLRLALHHIDEQYAQLRMFGYYESPAAASAALERLTQLRPSMLDHPRVTYLGLRSAIEEATLSQDGPNLTIDARLTLHQTRYLMRMVARLLAPRQ